MQFQNKRLLIALFAENKVTSFVPINIKSIRDLEIERESTMKKQQSIKEERIEKMPKITGDIDEGAQLNDSY